MTQKRLHVRPHFDWIPYIACINLKSREDRFAAMRKTFARAGILDRVKFFRVEKHAKGGRYGCYESHLKVYKDCLKNGNNKFALVFEDDVAINVENVRTALAAAKRAMRLDPKWTKINLQNTGLFEYVKEVDRNIHRSRCVIMCSYIISRRAMERSLDVGITTLHVDNHQYCDFEYNLKKGGQYLITPHLASTQPFGSDNSEWEDDPFLSIFTHFVQHSLKHTTLFMELPHKFAVLTKASDPITRRVHRELEKKYKNWVEGGAQRDAE